MSSSSCRNSSCVFLDPGRPRIKEDTSGFALFFVVVLLGAVCFFLVIEGQYGLLEKRLLKTKEHKEKAKDIALFALDIALAHLKHSLGPNGRTSTVPFPYPGVRETYYTAAWKKASTGQATFIGYLIPPVSGDGFMSFFQDSLEVTVPLVSLPQATGYYTYWIGDEGVKAKLNLGNSLKQGKHKGLAFIQPQALQGFEDIASEDLAAYNDWTALAKSLAIENETLKQQYPHFTLKSYGLLGQPTLNAPSSSFDPKKDLTALETTPIPLDPEERLIQDFHHLGQSVRLDPSPHLAPKPFTIKRDNPYEPAQLERLGLGPLCLACRLGFNFELQPPSTLKIYEGMWILLWNPYAVALDRHEYTLSLVCNKNPSITLHQDISDQPLEQWIDLGEHNLEERGYPYTVLKAKLSTAFLAGQKKAFVLKNASLDPLQPTLYFEEVESTHMPIGIIPQVWLKNEPYLLEAKTTPLLKDGSLHAKRHVRRQRIQNPYHTQGQRTQPRTEQKLTLADTRQVLCKTRETPSWPDMVLRLESAEKAYGPKSFLFHELSLPSLSLKPLVLQETKDSKELRSAQVGFEYRLDFRAEMPFQNNPRAFLPPDFKPHPEATWEWSWTHNLSNPFRDFSSEDLKPLALFDIGPLDSLGKLRHLLLSLDPHASMYTEDKRGYWDSAYCPHRLMIQKGKQNIIEGAFNINSRSTQAWASVLLTALKPELRSGGTFARTQFHTPNYTISPHQAASLAEHIVELLNAAPPYFSLSSFISAGILDKALEKLNLPYQDHPLLALNAFDMLENIGPLLTPSSDTFIIRTHGASFFKKDHTGKPLYQTANCEALVQRVLERNPGTDTLEARFRVLNLRWVEADKL